MLRIGADDSHHALAVDDLALVTHFFDRRSYFHFSLPQDRSCALISTVEQFFRGQDRAAIIPPAPDRPAEPA